MIKWLVRRRRGASQLERYITLIFWMITDIKNIEYLKKIYEFTEVMWKKERREAGGEEN